MNRKIARRKWMMYPPKQQHALTCSHTHTHSHSRSAEMKTKINLKINTSVKSGKTLFRARTHTYTRKLLAVLFCSHWCVFIYTHKLEEKTQTTQNRTYNIPIYNNFFFFCFLFDLSCCYSCCCCCCCCCYQRKVISCWRIRFVVSFSCFFYFFFASHSLVTKLKFYYTQIKLFVTKISWKFFNHRSQFPSLWKEGERGRGTEWEGKSTSEWMNFSLFLYDEIHLQYDFYFYFLFLCLYLQHVS